MSATHSIDGVNLRTSYGLILQAPLDRVVSASKASVFPVYGRIGSGRGTLQRSPNPIQYTGTLVASTAATRETNEQAVLGLLSRDGFTLTEVTHGGNTRVLADCVLDGKPSVTPVTQLASAWRFAILGAEGTWRDNSQTTVTIASAGVDYSLALGSADSEPIITIPTPNAAEVVTLKDGSGATVNTLTFAGIGAVDSLVIDCVRGEIETITAAVATRAINKLASGTFPFAILRSWYNSSTAPTIRTSHNDGSVSYYKRYW